MATTIDLAKHFALFLILLSVLSQISNGQSGYTNKNVLFSEDQYRIRKGEILKNGNYTLRFNADCILELNDASNRIWRSSNPGFDTSLCGLFFNQNGELSIYDRGNRVWVSERRADHPYGRYALILQNNRNLVIHGPDIWCVPNCYRNGRNVPNPNRNPFDNKMITNADVGCETNKGIVLYTNQSLAAGECLKYDEFTLKMQRDCNLVLYDGDNVKWSTNTGGKDTNCYLYMPYDGNLAVRRPDLQVLWSAFPSYKDDGSYVLVLSPFGKIIIFGTSIWATGTNIAK